MTIRNDIVQEARLWLGVRFKHQGRSRAGIDCAGLIILVGKELGLMTHDETSYARRPDGYELINLMNKHLVLTSNTQPDKGDILLLAYDGYPQHLAIKTDTGMIHAFANARRVVEHGYDERWQERLVNIYVYRGVN